MLCKILNRSLIRCLRSLAATLWGSVESFTPPPLLLFFFALFFLALEDEASGMHSMCLIKCLWEFNKKNLKKLGGEQRTWWCGFSRVLKMCLYRERRIWRMWCSDIDLNEWMKWKGCRHVNISQSLAQDTGVLGRDPKFSGPIREFSLVYFPLLFLFVLLSDCIFLSLIGKSSIWPLHSLTLLCVKLVNKQKWM